MFKFFQYDSPIFRFLEKIGDLIILSVLWLLTISTLVLAGNGCAALYYAVVKNIKKDRGRPVSSFFHALKTNWKASFPLTIILFAYSALVYFNIRATLYLDYSSLVNCFYYYFCRLLVLPLLFILPWIFPLLSRVSASFTNYLKLASFLAFKKIHYTFLLLLLMLICIAASLFSPVFLFFTPGAYAFLSSFFIEKTFVSLLHGNAGFQILQDQNPDKWYLE